MVVSKEEELIREIVDQGKMPVMQEFLQLAPEEAFYLLYHYQCLEIIQPDQSEVSKLHMAI